ncbi:hypothetical protein LR68_00529 [Anoxybacillus sp. BCO1]|nr:hypothetical protein LR68_00529 [Anoxybacillus sp. BCO1]
MDGNSIEDIQKHSCTFRSYATNEEEPYRRFFLDSGGKLNKVEGMQNQTSLQYDNMDTLMPLPLHFAPKAKEYAKMVL